jgi:hemerythrin-like domain-containing protein
MAGLSELGQLLHEEHFRILVAICELQNRIGGASADRPVDVSDAEDGRLLNRLLASLDHVIVHHVFEETVVFPLIRDRGESELTALLTREHGAIEPKARLLRMLARQLVGHGANPSLWTRFRSAAADLVVEVMCHLEKEELTVVQRLSSLLDADTDHELAARHRGFGSVSRCETATLAAIPGRPVRRTSRSAVATPEAAARAAARRRSMTPVRP